MKKELFSLYLMTAALLLVGWYTARDIDNVFIRRDCLVGAITIAVCASILTIGYFFNRLKESAHIVKVGAWIYVVYIVTRLSLEFEWAGSTWWIIPIGVLLTIFLSIPAMLAYSIANDIIQKAESGK